MQCIEMHLELKEQQLKAIFFYIETALSKPHNLKPKICWVGLSIHSGLQTNPNEHFGQTNKTDTHTDKEKGTQTQH